jgi:hypothetical protein
MKKLSPEEQRRKFFKTLFSKTKHDIELRPLQSKDRLFTRDTKKIEDFITEHNNTHILFGVATREGGGGTKENARELPCLYADIDFDTFKGGEREAKKLLKKFPLQPTIIVKTGGGFHCYWLLKEPIEATTEIEGYLKGIARALKADMSVTEIARCLRVPYTYNYKYKPPRPATIESFLQKRYTLKDFEKFIEKGQSVDTHAGESTSDYTIEKILDCGCEFLNYAYEHRENLPEPLWYAMISNVARIAPQLAHEFSKGYRNYNRQETDQKILHSLNDASGGHLCQTIKQHMKAHLGHDCGKNCNVNAPLLLLNRKLRLKKQNDTGGTKSCIEIITASELDKLDLPEPQWIIPGLLPEGVTLCCGKPKVGKSFLCLNISLDLAKGGKVFDVIKVKKTDVLYLALEDNQRSIKNRMRKILTSLQPAPNNLYISTKCSRFDMGGLDALKDELNKHKNIKLVIVDTLQKVRPPKTNNALLYEYDYQALQGLKAIADERNITIVVVHHLRKTASEDPLDEVSGTTGLTGASDNVMTLKKNQNKCTATLKITGRNIEEKELTLSFDKLSTRWRLIEDEEGYHITEQREAIIALLYQEQQPLSPKQIAKRLQQKENNIQFLLGKMQRDGQIKKVSRGKYTYLPTTHIANDTNNAHITMNAHNAKNGLDWREYNL